MPFALRVRAPAVSHKLATPRPACRKLVHVVCNLFSSARHTSNIEPDNVQTLAASPSARGVSLVVSDVDGTLLNSQQQLTPGVEHAVQAAVQAGVPVLVATGKARGPWAADVLPRLGPAMPGVFLQGLLVCDAQGNVIHSRALPQDVSLDCIQLAESQGVTLTAYCGARILCECTNEHTDVLKFYREPDPEPMGPLAAVVPTIDINKLIFMAPHPRIEALRPAVEALLEGRASLTTALPGMLEVLPLGASKGAGLAWLLGHMGVAPEAVMAMGDGENDIEMLQLAGVSVAMGNAGPKVVAVADVLVSSNDEDGVAEAIRRFVLEPRHAAAAADVAAAR